MSLIIKKASAIESDVTSDIADIFVECFAKELEFYSRNRDKLLAAFTDAVNADAFYVAMEKPDRILGIAACSEGGARGFSFEGTDLKRILGFYKGSIARFSLTSEFDIRPTLPASSAFIECIAVRGSSRGKRIASGLVQGVIDTLSCGSYLIDPTWVVTDDDEETKEQFLNRLDFTEQVPSTNFFPKDFPKRTLYIQNDL